jgi:hypothetical protein
MELLGAAWPIWGELGRLSTEQGETKWGQKAYGEAAVIIRRLAETIDDKGLREEFVTANPVRSILTFGKQV